MSKATRKHSTAPPLTDNELKDPDFQSDPHYSKWCGRGSIVVIHPKTHELTITPLRCGSWTCDYCGPKKSQELRRRVKSARPNRFITLTCAHPGTSTPAQAEEAMRKGWPKFIARLRETCPELEYFRVIEWQENGWPHFHLLVRCDYLPKEILQNAWQKFCWPGFVDIKLVKVKDGIPWEIVKYIIKAYKVAKNLDKHQRLFCSSREFFPARSAGDVDEPDPTRIWFITSLTPDDVSFRLRNEMFAIETILAEGCGYHIAAREGHGSDWLELLLPDLEGLPWYNAHNNNLPHAPPSIPVFVSPSGRAQQQHLMPYPEQLAHTMT